MEQYVTAAIGAVRETPLLGAGIAAAIVVGYLFLNRKPRMQREADDRLAAIRREKADQYNKTRPLR